jgi:hypothetical protein
VQDLWLPRQEEETQEEVMKLLLLFSCTGSAQPHWADPISIAVVPPPVYSFSFVSFVPSW